MQKIHQISSYVWHRLQPRGPPLRFSSFQGATVFSSTSACCLICYLLLNEMQNSGFANASHAVAAEPSMQQP